MEFDGRVVPGGLDASALKQLLSRGWMTHDGMWFMQVLSAHGIEEANRLNLGAIRTMAPIEVKRIMKALGLKVIAGDADVQRLLLDGIGLLIVTS